MDTREALRILAQAELPDGTVNILPVMVIAEAALDAQPQPTGDVVEEVRRLEKQLEEANERAKITWDAYNKVCTEQLIAAMQQPSAPACALTEDETVEVMYAAYCDIFERYHANREWKRKQALRAAYRALSALHGNSVKGEWQPIETAPKDGTLVDLWVVFDYAGTGDYDDGIRAHRWSAAHWDGDYWVSNEGHRTDNFVAKVTVTHWMPLPKPPTSTDTAKGEE